MLRNALDRQYEGLGVGGFNPLREAVIRRGDSRDGK